MKKYNLITLEKNLYQDDITKYFFLRNRDGMTFINVDFNNEILESLNKDSIYDTIVVLDRKKEMFDDLFYKFESHQKDINDNIKKIIKSGYHGQNFTLHSKKIEEWSNSCLIGENIFFYKFSDLKNLKGFFNSIDIEVKIEIYTYIEEKKIIMKTINNTTNTTQNGLINNSVTNQNTEQKKSIWDKILNLIKRVLN